MAAIPLDQADRLRTDTVALGAIPARARVRIVAKGLGPRRIALLEPQSADTLLVCAEKGRRFVRVPVADVSALELSAGKGASRDQVLRGMLFGTAIGGLFATLLDMNKGIRGAGIGLAIGAAGGFVVGESTRTDVWRPVRLPHEPAIRE